MGIVEWTELVRCMHDIQSALTGINERLQTIQLELKLLDQQVHL